MNCGDFLCCQFKAYRRPHFNQRIKSFHPYSINTTSRTDIIIFIHWFKWVALMLIPKKLSHPIYATYYEDLISNSSWIVGQIYWQHTIQLAFCVAFLTFSDNQTYFCTLLFALINKYMYLIAGNISLFFFNYNTHFYVVMYLNSAHSLWNRCIHMF